VDSQRARFWLADTLEGVRLGLFWKGISLWVLNAVGWVSGLSALVFAALFKDLVSRLAAAHAWGDWHSYVNARAVPCALAALVSAAGAKFKTARQRTQNRKAAYDALKRFHTGMGFDAAPEHDIRCTLWCPTRRKDRLGRPVELEQWTDYVPAERPQGAGAVGVYRDNAKAGRRRPIFRRVPGGVETIGLMGHCAYECIKNRRPAAKMDYVPDGMDLVTYLVDVWHFDRHYAERLTPDRRSFLCLPLMDAGYTELLGIVFCDSSSPSRDVLSARVAADAEKFFPDIARAILQKQ
jgi:hypothetical protein